MGCVREMSQIKKKKEEEASTGCLRETPHIKEREKASMGCVRETPQIKKRSQQGMCKRNSPDKK